MLYRYSMFGNLVTGLVTFIAVVYSLMIMIIFISYQVTKLLLQVLYIGYSLYVHVNRSNLGNLVTSAFLQYRLPELKSYQTTYDHVTGGNQE